MERILFEVLESLIRDEARDPSLTGVRLVSVELSADGASASIPYVVEADVALGPQVERSSREALGRASGFLRARLAALLDQKRLPKLTFRFVGTSLPAAPADGGSGGEP